MAGSNHSAKSPRVWKVSHGKNSFYREQRDELRRKHLIALHSRTKKGQARAFKEDMRAGDSFYLCHGNDIQLLGKLTSKGPTRGRGWLHGFLLRRYRTTHRIKPTANTTHYGGEPKGWTPNYNSTCKLVPEDEINELERVILRPFFGVKLSGLAVSNRRDGDSGVGSSGHGHASTPSREAELKEAGWEKNPEIREAIESYAVKSAKTYFKRRGYEVYEQGKPYDLLCRRGRSRKFIEVKGTRSEAESVLLTGNEVVFARANENCMALYVRHSVRVKGRKKPVVVGGRTLLLDPWRISSGSLRPVEYIYALPR
jgi:hypothetical protein